MLELMDKIYNLKNSLDKVESIEEINKLYKCVIDNKELVEKIKEYNIYPNNNLKKEIYEYDEIKKYKECENNINIMILEINQKLNKIIDNGGCSNACN